MLILLIDKWCEKYLVTSQAIASIINICWNNINQRRWPWFGLKMTKMTNLLIGLIAVIAVYHNVQVLIQHPNKENNRGLQNEQKQLFCTTKICTLMQFSWVLQCLWDHIWHHQTMAYMYGLINYENIDLRWHIFNVPGDLKWKKHTTGLPIVIFLSGNKSRMKCLIAQMTIHHPNKGTDLVISNTIKNTF